MVGLDVGDPVGAPEGLSVVGSADGLVVGESVGERVGLDVGEPVGSAVGLLVVGAADGLDEGLPEGAFVGA